MNLSKLENICRGLLLRIRNKEKYLDREKVENFLEQIILLLDENIIEDLPDDYKKLYSQINEQWYYKKFDQISLEESFLLGGVWAAQELVEKKYQMQKENRTLEKLKSKYMRFQPIFRTVIENPGVQHKDLARMVEKSTSELSQIMAKIDGDNLIVYSRAGREKHYYISDKGKRLCDQIQQEKVRNNLMTNLFAVVATNISAIGVSGTLIVLDGDYFSFGADEQSKINDDIWSNYNENMEERKCGRITVDNNYRPF